MGAPWRQANKILLAGESWVTTATHIKGFDQFPTVDLPSRRRAAGRGAERLGLRLALHALA